MLISNSQGKTRTRSELPNNLSASAAKGSTIEITRRTSSRLRSNFLHALNATWGPKSPPITSTARVNILVVASLHDFFATVETVCTYVVTTVNFTAGWVGR